MQLKIKMAVASFITVVLVGGASVAVAEGNDPLAVAKGEVVIWGMVGRAGERCSRPDWTLLAAQFLAKNPVQQSSFENFKQLIWTGMGSFDNAIVALTLPTACLQAEKVVKETQPDKPAPMK